MSTLPHPRASSLRLTASEREIVLTIADDEQSWHVHTDSRRAASGRLLRAARAWGVEPRREGAGYGFDLPLAAVRFAGPVRTTERQRQAGREALRKARLSRRNPTVSVGGETVGAAARG